MQVVVAETLAAAVGIESVVVPQQVVGLVWLGDGMLLIDAFPYIGTGGLSYLDPSWEGCVVVHVDLRYCTPIVGEDLVYCLHIGMFLLTTLRCAGMVWHHTAPVGWYGVNCTLCVSPLRGDEGTEHVGDMGNAVRRN